VAAGANEGSLLVYVSMVGDKYVSRDEWGSMSDANRFLSGVMAKTTVNRPVRARALRMETVPAIIDIFTVMSWNQDQQILAAAL
jgi:hypothetical protein